MENTKSSGVLRLTQTALLIALIVLAVCLPLKILAWEFTPCTIPVAIGAILLGPATGALLGTVFGLCSFAQCFGWFCPSPLGAALVAVNPLYAAIMCILPRLLMGFLCGLICRGVTRLCPRRPVIASGVACLSAALLNTVLFTATLFMLFGRTETIMSLRGSQSVLVFLAGFVGINGVLEAIATCVIGTALVSSLQRLFRRHF